MSGILEMVPFAISQSSSPGSMYVVAQVPEEPARTGSNTGKQLESVLAHSLPGNWRDNWLKTSASSDSAILWRAIAAYSGFNSSPIKWRSWWTATTPVVPEPLNGSSTMSPGLLPARMHGSTSFCGKTAK